MKRKDIVEQKEAGNDEIRQKKQEIRPQWISEELYEIVVNKYIPKQC